MYGSSSGSFKKYNRSLYLIAKRYKNDDAIRIGLLGAGPSGLAVMNAFAKKLPNDTSSKRFDIVCLEKQSQIGGLWNYDWRTDANANGSPVHASMYRHLWTNSPKETVEMADYTYQQHFGDVALNSFPPRVIMEEYIKGRAVANQVESKFDVRFNTNVLRVQATSNDQFQVDYEQEYNLEQAPSSGRVQSETFDHVIVATGHFSVPNIVEFEGFDSFRGSIVHSHSFRFAEPYKGRHVLVIGGSFSADDIAIQCWKFGAKKVTVSSRNGFGFTYPPGMQEKPQLTKIVNGKDAVFENGDIVTDIDDIILCTGFLHYHPFMSEDLRLRASNELYLQKLYKGVAWTDNPKLFYIGMQNQWFSFPLFDLQATYIRDVILQQIQLPNKQEMDQDIEEWYEKLQQAVEVGTPEPTIRFQTDYMIDLWSNLNEPQEYVDCPSKLDRVDAQVQWLNSKNNDILTFRDFTYKSYLTGVQSSPMNKPWIETFDDSKEAYLDACNATQQMQTN